MDTETLIIGGRAVATTATAAVTNPYSGEVIARVPQADHDQVLDAIAAARTAFATFRHWPAHRRAGLCAGVAHGIAQARDELGHLITAEAGKPITQALAEVDRAVSTFTIAAEEAKRLAGEAIPADVTAAGEGYTALTRRVPVGPISAIAPFNFPLNLVAHKLAPALAAGCTVVLKPPVQAPLTALRLGRIVHDAGAPDGVFQVVPCGVEAARPLITDERMTMLSFTGSDRVGWHLKGICGKKRVALELGGNAAAVVCADADLDAAAGRIAFGAFAYAGQICISVQRILVQEDVYEPFVAALVKATEALPVGDPAAFKTVVGPLIDGAAADRVTAWIAEATAAGARLLSGGTRAGNVVRPTLLAGVTPGMKVCCAEVFGPVATVQPFATFEDAVRMVNDSPYGLQAGVFTTNLRHALYAHRHMEVGGVVVGDIPTLRFDHAPYGGSKDSGLGREGVRYAMEEMTEPRLLLIKE
ncbi:MAG: aldehyde dehydrogenase family protein [Nitrospirae bacterium]|nr:aldehyde dehydrogenase family protein [Nitrospirota bacterium]